MQATLPAPTGYTIPQVRELGENAARGHLAAVLGTPGAELPLQLKRQQRSRDRIVPWTNRLLYEVAGPKGTVGIAVEVDEHQHAAPSVVLDETRIVRSRTPFLAAGWPKWLAQRLPRRQSARWAQKQLGL